MSSSLSESVALSLYPKQVLRSVQGARRTQPYGHESAPERAVRQSRAKSLGDKITGPLAPILRLPSPLSRRAAARLAGIRRTAQLPVPVERVPGRLVARGQREMREGLPVQHRRVAPPARLGLLDAEEALHAAESIRVHSGLEPVPGALHPAHGVDARLVMLEQIFPQRTPRAQVFTPADVVEPQKEVVGHRVAAREPGPHRGRILAHRVAARGRAVEAEAD